MVRRYDCRRPLESNSSTALSIIGEHARCVGDAPLDLVDQAATDLNLSAAPA
jgi:hypothetical protein